MANLFKPTYTATDPLTGRKSQRRTKKWYGQFTDAGGIARRVPLSANKTAAQQMLNELVRKAELGKIGIGDPYCEHRKRQLAEHLLDFQRCLESKGNTVSNRRSERPRWRVRSRRTGTLKATMRAAARASRHSSESG